MKGDDDFVNEAIERAKYLTKDMVLSFQEIETLKDLICSTQAEGVIRINASKNNVRDINNFIYKCERLGLL